MSINEMNKELEKSYSEEEVVNSWIITVSDMVLSVYKTLNHNDIMKKITAELEELHFENNDELVDFLDVQSDNYNYLHGKLCNECTKIIQKLGWGYNVRRLSPIDFKYDSEKESFIFYGYYDNKVYKEINLKILCEKLNSKKYLVF